MFHFLTAALLRNDKATFYTDTMASPHMRGRQSIVPYVDVLPGAYFVLIVYYRSCANILGGGSRYCSVVHLATA